MEKEDIEALGAGELPPRISFIEQRGGSAGYYAWFKDLPEEDHLEEEGGPIRKYVPILQLDSQEEALQRFRAHGYRYVHVSSPASIRVGMNKQGTPFANILSWASRAGGAAVMLSLIGVLAWGFSSSGGWWLPAGGAVTGGLTGWKKDSSGSGRAETGLTYAVRGAALGLVIMFLYQSGCTPAPQEPGGEEPDQEMVVQAPLPLGLDREHPRSWGGSGLILRSSGTGRPQFSRRPVGRHGLRSENGDNLEHGAKNASRGFHDWEKYGSGKRNGKGDRHRLEYFFATLEKHKLSLNRR